MLKAGGASNYCRLLQCLLYRRSRGLGRYDNILKHWRNAIECRENAESRPPGKSVYAILSLFYITLEN
eukprot:scaffold2899_cov85-Skeletonema_dohrnii-CCMP3373.AAC.11